SFRRDSNDRVLNAIQILGTANDIGIAMITILPGPITDHRHWMRVAPGAFLWTKSTAENRLHSERVEIICRDYSTSRALSAITHTKRGTRYFVDDERFDEPGIFFIVEEFGIRKSCISGLAARRRIQCEHAVLMRNKRIWTNQNSFDPAQYRSVRSDTESQAKD